MTPEEYSEEDAEKDRRTIYIQTAVKVAGHYLPAVGLGILLSPASSRATIF